MSRPPALVCLRLCLPRLRQVSPSRLLFGDEPWLVLLALVVGGFVFYPLMRDDWPWLLGVIALAGLSHAWYWCCQEARSRMSESGNKENP